jgi:selenocysteine lyase/cysteine desulfurase
MAPVVIPKDAVQAVEFGGFEPRRASGQDRASALSEPRRKKRVSFPLCLKAAALRQKKRCTEGTVRPSLAFYNTPQEIDQLAAALREL